MGLLKPLLAVFLLALIALLVWLATRGEPNLDDQDDNQPPEVARRSIPAPTVRPGHVGSSVCQECHQDQHASWHKTYHRTMTQVASPQTIQANFDGQSQISWGQEFRFDRDGDDFLVTMPDLQWQADQMERGQLPAEFAGTPPTNQYKVVMATGSHNAQHYWVEGLKEEQPVRIPFVYLVNEKRLVPSHDAWLQAPDWWKSRHYFEHNTGLWNRACSSCHSLAAAPGFDLETGDMRTQFAELGISCESCHGPGLEHAQFQQTQLLALELDPNKAAAKSKVDNSKRRPDKTIVNPAHLSHRASTHLCGRCHSEFVQRDPVNYMQRGLEFKPGKMLGQWVKLSYFGDGKAPWVPETYWPDGTQRVSGDEFLGTTASPCFLKGEMSCISCHSMHDSEPNKQLAEGMHSNQACLQCHEEMASNISEHTHHAADSTGSNCMNCHMPHTAYAFLAAQRTHRIDSPSVDNSVEFGKPNACNLCHLDKSLDWTAQQLKSWYDIDTKSELPAESKQQSAAAKWMLSGNAVQRAVTGWHFGWEPALQASGRDWQPRLLAEELDDSYSVIRKIAQRSLTRFSEFESLKYDFIGPPEQRRQVRDAVIERWKKSETAQETLRRILNDTDSDRQVEKFLKNQDKSPLGLFE